MSCSYRSYIACHAYLRANVLAGQRGLRANVPGCQRVKSAKFSFLRANVPKNVPACHKACQCFNLACQRAKQRANFHLGVPTCQRACQLFKHSSYEVLREISILYYYIKNSTLYLISYFYISFVYVSYI